MKAIIDIEVDDDPKSCGRDCKGAAERPGSAYCNLFKSKRNIDNSSFGAAYLRIFRCTACLAATEMAERMENMLIKIYGGDFYNSSNFDDLIDDMEATMNKPDIEAIKARLKAAEHEYEPDNLLDIFLESEETAELFINAPADIADLLAENERLTAENKRLDASIGRLQEIVDDLNERRRR